LPVLCADWQQVEGLVSVPERFRVRLSRIWPGALTVVCPCVCSAPATRSGTLAVRIPAHDLLRALLYRVGPLTGTSANRHRAAPPTDVEAALGSLVRPPSLVLDGGPTAGGSASTVVSLCDDEPRVVRQGAVDWEPPYPWTEEGLSRS
jgi:L-threonylcarbamoyladenylate synthase